MTTTQVTYSERELLADHDYAEPLVVRGQRCHGGFTEDGTYVSPRTRFRTGAIEAWDHQRQEQFGTPKLDIGLDTWPDHFPNVDQTKFLLRNGVREPIVSELTRIGTVEGFGAMLRYSPVPDFRKCFAEEIDGTAIDHLTGGLFEAHARDEAGHDSVAGHKEMWFIARDIAFEDPVTEDQTALMLERMGIPLGNPSEMARLRAAAEAMRLLPSDIDFELESLLARMIRLLFIEISAHHAFAWAEEVLSDTELVAGDGEAATLVSYIRSDEAPHVGYLSTVLSEMRDRTWIGTSGNRYPGTEMISTLWDTALSESIGIGRQQFLKMTVNEIRHALSSRPDGEDLWEEMLSLGSVYLGGDGEWTDASDKRLRSTKARGADEEVQS